ncbi:MAG: NAD(P)/FAD-dependent oxidoreductase [Clostridiaceae bacterium]|nr:NAD(P)/FAD-dependent oxidoreductase [Clostridiaceae bacterium]
MTLYENRQDTLGNTDKGIVIIGNGIAGLSAADAARKHNPEIPVTIISSEEKPTYYRLRLCNLLEEDTDIDSLYIHPVDWYKDKKIDVLLNKTVTSICSKEKYVVVNDSEKIPYSKLIISSGSRCFIPPVPGSDLPGVHTLWTIKDVFNINKELANTKHAVVIGGGLLGLEAAYHINKKGVKVTIIELMPRLLPNQLDIQGSHIFQSKVESLGINVLTNVSVKAIEGEKGVEKVLLSDGNSLSTNFVLFSAGVIPNIEVTQGLDIAINRRIVVDKYMRTNIEDIFAAGDVAVFNDRWYGQWSVAQQQGKIAGANAAGAGIEYVPDIAPYFLNTMDTKVSSLGYIIKDMSANHDSIEFSDKSRYIYQRLFFVDNVLSGAILIGDTSKATKISRAIKDGMTKEKVLENNLIMY